jgi:hypothetical protein
MLAVVVLLIRLCASERPIVIARPKSPTVPEMLAAAAIEIA